MASMRDIKRRKESIQSTQQITKAMKLVSTVKLQKARTRAESAKPYFLLSNIHSVFAAPVSNIIEFSQKTRKTGKKNAAQAAAE